MAEKPFIIAGGGIGGLAAALGLAKAGKHSLVLEQAERLGEIGAGIQIAPNAFNCFDFLGIGGALRENAVYIDRLRLMDALSGEEICHIPLDEDFRERFGNPYAVVHRADLHLALLEVCRSSGKVEMRTRQVVCGYRQDENTVFVQVENRDEIEGTALIGADGLRSAVRRQMLDDDPPRVSGHTTYRSVIPAESMPEDLCWNAATLWAGPKCHIVHYPLKGWKRSKRVARDLAAIREQAHPQCKRTLRRERIGRFACVVGADDERGMAVVRAGLLQGGFPFVDQPTSSMVHHR